MPRNHSTTRTRQLAAIHASAKELGLEEDGYRLMLLALTGKRSAGAMTDAERGEVLAFTGRARQERSRSPGECPPPVSDEEARAILGL